MQKFKKIDQYQLLQLLGKGANGMVFKGLDTNNGSLVAIKEMIIGKQDVGVIKTQLNMLKQLDHPNIVKYIDAIQKDNRIYLVIQYMEGGSLAALVKRNPLSEDVAKIYIKQVLAGLVFLHRQSVIHRDIKGANLLATKNGWIKLADFGVAVKLKDSQKAISAAGSPYWMPPQIISSQAQPSTKCDIWSLGCTVIELLTGHPPYYQLMQFPALFRIVEDRHPPLPECSRECRQFLLMCFQKNPLARATALELLSSNWLKSVHEQSLGPLAPKQQKLDGQIKAYIVPSVNYGELQKMVKVHKNSHQVLLHKYFQVIVQDSKSISRLPFLITMIQSDWTVLEGLCKLGFVAQEFDKLRERSENEQFLIAIIKFISLILQVYDRAANQMQGNLQSSNANLQILQLIIMQRCIPALAKLLQIFTKQDKKDMKIIIFESIHKLISVTRTKGQQEQSQILNHILTSFEEYSILKQLFFLVVSKTERDLSINVCKLEIILRIIPSLIFMAEIKSVYKKHLSFLCSELLKTRLQFDTEPISINKFLCFISLMECHLCKTYLERNGFIYFASEYFKFFSQRTESMNMAAVFESVNLIRRFIKNRSGGIDKNRVLQFSRHGGTDSLFKIYEFVLQQTTRNDKKQRNDGSLSESLGSLMAILQQQQA